MQNVEIQSTRTLKQQGRTLFLKHKATNPSRVRQFGFLSRQEIFAKKEILAVVHPNDSPLSFGDGINLYSPL
jgi:hypothetical protein